MHSFCVLVYIKKQSTASLLFVYFGLFLSDSLVGEQVG